MDATQMICDSMLESDEEEENGNARAEPLATLRVFKNKHIRETVLPLYLGENVLGRDPSNCTLPLHAQSVSKQHTAVSISVFHASSRRDCASIEALVWDMGSMNGTWKGRLKLTPHVRYALSEGDNLMVADIPCQYTSCVDPGSLVNRGYLLARESQGTREDVEVHTNGNAEEPTRASLGERREMMETPARIKSLSFEQTPTQPEGSLVPESDSDSDGERGRKDRWKKTLESDSHVTSPTCSTFLSPTNKIIPESEDESPITPSSSSKHRPTRCVSADNDEQDFGAWQQRLKNKKAAQFIAIDGKEEEEKVALVGTEPEKRGGCVPDSLVNSVSTWAKDGLDQPGPALPTELIQVLHMDSDIDMEGEEESSVSVGPGTPNRTQPAPPLPTAYAPTSMLGQFVMDSDTDVDDEDEGVDVTLAPTAGEANTTESPGEVLVAQQTDGETDVEGEDDEPDRVSKATHASPQSENTPVSWAGSTQPSDFHLESDTDEEEEDEEGDDAIAKSSSAKIEAESRGVVFASAAPQNFDLDSDTDDEVLPTAANSDPTSDAAHTTPASAADTGAHLDILSDSDTDVEEDSPPIPPAVAVATNAGRMSSAPPSSFGPISLSAALGPDSDADTDVEENSSSPVGVDVSTDPAVIRMDSDTDMEEEEAAAVGTEGGQVSSSSDEKDFGSLQGHTALLQHCSTPVELPGGAVAEMETQEYLSPSIDPFKCPRVPAPRLMVSLSCSDSQGEDDFVVAETQSFIVDDRDQQYSPSGNYTLDETQPFIPQGTSKHEDGLSESIHLQPKALALATESTQAFVLSDGDVNLEATQVYPTTPSLDGSSLELDSDLEATQSYLGSAGSSSRSAGSGIKRPMDISLEATQAFIPESHSDVDAEEEDGVDTMDIASTETQLMDFPSGYTLAMAETQLMCELQEYGKEPVDREDTPPVAAGTNCPLSSAETQPMATSGDEESDDEDSVPAPRKRRARRLVEEEDTQVITGSEPTAAETQPSSSTSSDESKEEEDERPGLKLMRSQNQRKLQGAACMRATAAGTEPEADSDTAQQAKGRSRRGRGRKPGPRTSRGGREEKEEEKEQEPPASLRSTRSKGETSSSTRRGTGVVRPEEERGEEEEEGEEADQMRQGGRRKTRQPRENAREKKERLEKERKEQAENERMLKEQEEQEKMERALREQEGKQRMERDRKEKEERERLERDREERERLEVEEKERIARERKEHEEKERLERIQREKEEQERLQREKKEREERERLEMEEKERVEREQKAREEKERLEKEEQERLERERKEREERLEKEEQERIENQREEREEKARLEQIQKEEEERLEQERKAQEERAREERERLEKERRELEETAREERERLEKERRELKETVRLEREKKESEEKQRLEREEKERERKELEEKERLKKEKSEQERERLRREKDERQQKAVLEREEREKSRRAQEEVEDQARLESEKREREEMERQSDERERLMKEALEKQLLERQQTEAQAQSDEQKPRTTRGRRATRTTAAQSEPDPEKDDGPASRTRSRSNSSNSVSSERSASSTTVQESRRGRGRGRGSKKNHPPAVGAGSPTRESKRRRTVTGDTPGETPQPSNGPGRATRSRSNSTDSLNSEVSACSSAQSRGRGARGAGRGRGRMSLPAPEINSQPSSSGQNEAASAPKASARGRKTKTLVAAAVDGCRGDGEDKPGSQQAATTRGHRRTNTAHPGPIGAEEQEDTPEDSTLVTRSTTGRGGGRKARLKCELVVAPVAVDRTDGVENNGSARAKGMGELESEHKEEEPAPVRRGRGSSVQVRRNPNEQPIQEEVEEEEEETIERKVRRGRQSVAKKKNKEEVAGEGVAPATHVMERDAGTSEVTQTPAGKSSRKRGAAPAGASPVAKSPRASGAPPGSQLRAACQPYKVLFTGLVDEAGEKVVVRLGGSLALGVSDMTHLVTDKVRRTVKFLCAMARGIPVVSTQWLEKSAKAGSFLSPSTFIVKDMEQEKKFNFCLRESIRIASNQPLLQGYEIHVTKSVKPEPTHMLDIISCCGASFLAKMPSSHKEQTVVVSCEEDWPLCGPAVAASLPVVSAEFLLTGILQQKADVEAHALPSAPTTTTPPQPAGARGRGRRRT